MLVCPICIKINARCGCQGGDKGRSGIDLFLKERPGEVKRQINVPCCMRCVQCGAVGDGFVQEDSIRPLTEQHQFTDNEGNLCGMWWCLKHADYRIAVARTIENECPSCHHTWQTPVRGGQTFEQGF